MVKTILSKSRRSKYGWRESDLDFVSLKVFVHGDELENYFKEFDAEILPSDFDGKGSKYDGKVTAAHLFD